MITNTYKFVDFVFKISTFSSFFHEKSTDYLTNDKIDVEIEITKEDIEFERQVAKENNVSESILQCDKFVEFTAVQRKVTNYLLDHDVFLVHGVLLEMDNEGYFFIASSGTGKSTQAQNWINVFGKRASIVNGDKPFIKIIDGKAYGYGTPWCGKEFLNVNKKVKISAIIGIERDTSDSIKKVSLAEIYPLLYQQVFKKTSKELLSKSLVFLDTLGTITNTYILKCTKEVESAKVAYRGIKEKLSFEDILDLDGKLTYITKGVSMMPLIRQDKDISTIVKINGRAKVNDVVLYKRGPGHYVLHRVIKVLKNGYWILGDNCFRIEKDITDKHILGVLETINKGNGTVVRLSDEKYHRYLKKLKKTRPIRRFKIFFSTYFSAFKRKIKKIFIKK